MSEEYSVQLFWFILLVTGFCMMLVVGGVFSKLAARKEYKQFLKLQAAREAWNKMMTEKQSDD